jgi:hypothetical protein
MQNILATLGHAQLLPCLREVEILVKSAKICSVHGGAQLAIFQSLQTSHNMLDTIKD